MTPNSVSAEPAAGHSPERLSDLVQTSRKFEQLVTLWRWSQQSKASDPRAIINTANEKFILGVEAAIARPYRRVITYENGRAEYRLDLYPEERLAALIAMADDLQSDRLLALVPAVVESVLERWKESVPDFEETTSILSSMEDESWSKPRMEPGLYGRIRAQMFAELANAYSFSDFMHVQEFIRQTPGGATDAENEAFSAGFYEYIRSQFSQDLSDITSDGDALDEMADFMSDMLKQGYDISEQYGRLMGTKDQRDEHADRRADEDYGQWKDQRGFERADEEVISSLFDSLR
jgi:hypothetical protein